MNKKHELHIYELLSSMTLYTTVTIKGASVDIMFDGGFVRPYTRRGRFSTSDPDIIKALEEDNSYNILWRKIQPEQIEGSDTPANETRKEPSKPTTSEDLTDYTLVPEISSGQKAKAYLLSALEGKITNADLKNNAEIRRVAEENKIRFTDWPVEE